MSIRVSSVLLRTIAVPALLLGFLGAVPQTASQPPAAQSGAAGRGRGHQPPAGGTLDHANRPLFWEGRVGPEDAPRGGEPLECAAVPCDRFRLKIDLPFGTFLNPNRPGGVQVALRWFGNPGRPHAAAGRSRLLRRVRHAAPVGLQGRRARRVLARDHRRVAVGVHPRARERLVRRVDRLRPELQRRAGGRVRGAGGSRVPAADPAGEAAAARPHVPRHRAHLVRHALVPDLRARSAGGIELLPERDGRRRRAARACASTRSSPTAAQGPVEIALPGADRLRRPTEDVRFPGLAAHLPQRRLVRRSAGRDGQLPHRSRPLSLFELRQCAAVAIEPAGREAGRRPGRGGAQGQLLHGRHPHRRVGREGRRAAEVLRARLPLPAGERRRHRRVPPGHQQRAGRTSTTGTSPTSTSR